VFAIMPERIRSLDALLSELNRSPICDKMVLPTGIRFLLNLDGTVVNSVDELVDGGNYVCASTAKLRRIAYLSITGPSWNSSARLAEGRSDASARLSAVAKLWTLQVLTDTFARACLLIKIIFRFLQIADLAELKARMLQHPQQPHPHSTQYGPGYACFRSNFVFFCSWYRGTVNAY